MKPATFTQRVQFKEHSLRGYYIAISCDIEFALVDITCLCLVDAPAHREPLKLSLLENVSFAKKISLCENALKAYSEKYHKEFEDCFRKFNNLNKARNKFAHSRIEYDPQEKDENMLIFDYVKESKQVRKEENMPSLLMELGQYREAAMRFVALVMILRKERPL